MWAYIKDNKIEQIYQRPKSLVLGEVRYPSNMFTKYTDAEKAAIGIYPVEDTGTKGDDRFENTSQATYTCLLYTSPSPRDGLLSRMPSSA